MDSTDLLDHLHREPSDDPYWSESSWFSWAIPEQEINGFFYYHFRPNMSCMLGGPAMWDLSGRHVWDFRYFDWQLMRTLPSGTYGIDYDKYDFETAWGMSVRILEPLSRYQLSYARHELRLDLVFEAIAEPNVYGRKGAGTGSRLHFEQPGRIRGTIELDAEVLEVDCFSIRDGSHGKRHLENPTTGAYTWSTADEQTAWQVLALDRDESRDTTVVAGYLLRDGSMAPIVEGTRRILRRSGARPAEIEVIATDASGRKLHAIGRERVPAELFLFPDHGQWWTQFAWDYDGITGALGEDQEYYGIQPFRRWHRAGPRAWSQR